MKKILLNGGIGDFLQFIPYLISPEASNDEVYVSTHQRDVASLFQSLGLSVKQYLYFESIDEQTIVNQKIKAIGDIQEPPRTNYFKTNPFSAKSNVFSNLNKVIGIHVGGSSYSINIQESLDLPAKNIPDDILKYICSLDYNILIFGSKAETTLLGINDSENIKVISEDNVYDSLSYVEQCDAFVGSDSAFKTLSVMLKIPTLVWLGDYQDNFRDRTFITPYVSAGIMETYRYTNLSDNRQIKLGLEKTKRFIDSVFNPRTTKLWTSIFTTGHGPMVLNLRDKGVCRDIFNTGHFEATQISLLTDLTNYLLTRQRNITIYDVGANVGTHTLALANISPSRIRVRSFEVQSKIFYMLCATVAINGLGNVDCHNVAVGDKNLEMININLPNYSEAYNYGSYEVENIQKTDNENMLKKHSEKICMVTLDSFNEPVDLLKVDVEGMEQKVLNGSRDLFSRSSPICFVEIFKSEPNELISFFKSKDYIGYSSQQDLLAIPSRFNLQVNGLKRIF